MKLLILSIVSTLSLSTFANYKWDLERNLQKLSHQVFALSTRNADLLTVQELRTSIRKLKDLKSTLLGLNRQYPTPVCSQESAERMRRTFKSIKIFAYSIKGPELSTEEATNFAIDWTNTYPCAYSETYQRTYLTVKRYAYATNGGLGLSKEDAIKYASDNAINFCGDKNFKNDFWAAFKLARYEMEMPQAQATEHAKRIVERDHFTCRWDDRVVENNVDLTQTPFDLSNTCVITPIIVPGMPTVTPGVPAPRTPRAPRVPRN